MPRASELASLNPRQPKNHVKANVNKAVFEMQPNQKSAAAAEENKIAGKNKNYGKVPNYLNKFKNQRDDVAKQQAIDEEMARHPPGTRLMPEAERQETLRDL